MTAQISAGAFGATFFTPHPALGSGNGPDESPSSRRFVHVTGNETIRRR
jgi:hypothetical protein